MTDKSGINLREVQQEIGIISSFLKSTDPEGRGQAEPKLVDLIDRLSNDQFATCTKTGV